MSWEIREYEVIDSTNLEARRLVKVGRIRGGTVVWAHHQTRGRGTRGRSWWSLPGMSLTATLVFEGVQSAHATRLISVSAVAAIREAGGRGPLIKWPNDLVYGGRKAAGVLAESFGDLSGDFTAAGIGINVACAPPESVTRSGLPATSLLVEEKRLFSIEGLLDGLLAEVESREGMDRSLLMDEYRGFLACVGEAVSIRLPPAAGKARGVERLCGTLEGVDEDGSLLLSVGGRTVRITSGEMLAPEARWDPGLKAGLKGKRKRLLRRGSWPRVPPG